MMAIEKGLEGEAKAFFLKRVMSEPSPGHHLEHICIATKETTKCNEKK